MLTVNEQSELDILLTVEEPNEYMKKRIRELTDKRLSDEPLNQDEEACDCLGCRLAKCTKPEEHMKVVFNYLLTEEDNIIKYVQEIGELTDEEIDSLLKVIQPEKQLTTLWRKWALEEFCQNIDENSEAYKLFEREASNENSLVQKEVLYFSEGLIRECFSALALSKSEYSFKAFFNGIFIKNFMLALVRLSKRVNIPFTDKNFIGALLINVYSYLNSVQQEIFKPASMITKPIVGIL